MDAFRYAGEYWDAETGTYYLRARYYDPAVGRFTTEDTVSGVSSKLANGQEIVDPLSLNLYTYCGGNPLMYRDSSGHFPVETALDVASIAWSAADFFSKPTWFNAAMLLWDVAATAIPYVPGSYVLDGVSAVAKVVDKADDAVDAARVIGNSADNVIDAVRRGESVNNVANKITKSQHAQIRSSQGRNVNTAINDLNKAKPANIFMQDDGRYVIKGSNGRVHILETSGDLVTTMNKVTNFDKRVSTGKYIPLTEAQKAWFAKGFGSYLNNSWSSYK